MEKYTPSEWRKEKNREATKHAVLILALIICFVIVAVCDQNVLQTLN